MGEKSSTRLMCVASLFLGVAFTACLGPGSPDDAPAGSSSIGRVLVYEDAAGDARMVKPECERTGIDRLREAALPQLREPAPPSQDVLAVYVEETPEVLYVELELAELDPEFLDAAPADSCGGTRYEVVWTTWGGTVSYDVSIFTAHRINGVLVTTSSFYVWCNKWWWCNWEIPVELRPGSPGSITWAIPRVLMSTGDRGDELVSFVANVRPQNAPQGLLSGQIDGSETAGASYVLTTAMEPSPGPHDTTIRTVDFAGDEFRSFAGNVPDEPRPDLDILEFVFIEDIEHLTFAVQFAHVSDTPVPLQVLEVGVGLPSRNTYYAQATVDSEGSRQIYSYFCSQYWICETDTVTAWLSIAEGRPGWLNVTVPREELDGIDAGAMTHVVYAVSGLDRNRFAVSGNLHGIPDLDHPVTDCPAAMVTTAACSGQRVWSDWAPLMPPHWFQYDSQGRSR